MLRWLLVAVVLAAGMVACVPLGLGPAPTPVATPAPTPVATPTPILVAEADLEFPRCQTLRPPRATEASRSRPRTAAESPYVECEWGETLSKLAVPDNWQAETGRGGGGSESQLAFLPQDDPGLRRVSLLVGGVPAQLRGQDGLTLRADALFEAIFGERAADSRTRQAGGKSLSVATGPLRSNDQGIDGPASGVAIGFSDGYQLWLYSAVTATPDVRRVEDLLVKTAESTIPRYSRQ